jgi:hypothetical protein
LHIFPLALSWFSRLRSDGADCTFGPLIWGNGFVPLTAILMPMVSETTTVFCILCSMWLLFVGGPVVLLGGRSVDVKFKSLVVILPIKKTTYKLDAKLKAKLPHNSNTLASKE